ncbi:esterase/lipase family protein [Bradyrhizobium japonicum]|uniref:esterase/lipase family protein n=1 Tax=Bradyrhizobium japonicum TaxID=375 RepID=UPI0012FE06B0|nr:hypothetical protein [Bradyrhizobium japonicum]
MARIVLFVLLGVLISCQVAEAQVKRPLIFIPGILGSRLCEVEPGGKSGEVIWGDLGSLSDFGILELKLDGSEKPLKPCGLIQTIVSLGPLWQADVYTSLLRHLKAIGYDNDQLFIFDYDWRRSNVETADALARFIADQPRLNGQDVDILAHSMGGIVAKLFVIRHPDEAQKVKRLITMGTPFQGAARVLEVLAKGWGPFFNEFVSGRLAAIRRTALSFPAVYELFPNYQFGRACCRYGRIGEPNSPPADIFDPAQWTQNRWRPADYQAGALRAAFDRNLAAAREVRAVLANRPANGPQEIRFIGNWRGTPLYLYIDPARPEMGAWQFSEGPGDGVVPVWSAADAIDGSLDGRRPTFATHMTIFNDKGLQESLRFELAEVPPPRRGPGMDVAMKNGTAILNQLDLDSSQYFVRTGDPVAIRATLRFRSTIGDDTVAVTARQADQAGAVALVDISTPQERAADTLAFHGEMKLAGPPGPKRIDVEVPGVGLQSLYLEVLP